MANMKNYQKVKFTANGSSLERTANLMLLNEDNLTAVAYAGNSFSIYHDVNLMSSTELKIDEMTAFMLLQVYVSMFKEEETRKAHETARTQMNDLVAQAKGVIAKQFPTCQLIKNTLRFPSSDLSIGSWSVGQTGPHHLSIWKKNDLGTGNYHIVQSDYDDRTSLKGDSEKLMAQYCPPLRSIDCIQNGLDLIKVTRAERDYQTGDKESVVFYIDYSIDIPVLTPDNFDEVCKQLLTASSRM